MSDQTDDYLWTRSGPIDPDVAGLERQLASLAWRGETTPIEHSRPQPVIAVVPPRPQKPTSSVAWWPAVAAGFAVAATVFVVAYVSRDQPEAEPVERRSIEPAGQPRSSSPDLKDPFRRPDGVSPPSGELVDPFGSDTTKPARPEVGESDLKDPFGREPSGNTPTPSAPSPAKPGQQSSDLKDPFGNSSPPPHEPGKVVDPFGGTTPKPKPPDNDGGDLVDPFGKN